MESFKFVGKQIFAGSWGCYFVCKLCYITMEDNSYLIYLKTTERVIFLTFYYATNTSMHPEIARSETI